MNPYYKIIPFIKSFQDLGFDILYYNKCNNNISLINFYQYLSTSFNSYNFLIVDEKNECINCSLKKILYHFILLPLHFDLVNIEKSNANIKIKNIYNSYFYSVSKYSYNTVINNVNNNVINIASSYFISKEALLKICNYYIIDNNINLNINNLPNIYKNIDDFKLYICKLS
jgi:hypothetical protein